MTTFRQCIARSLGVLFAVAWILIWSAATLLFDYGLATSAWRQLLALTYEHAPGVITSSRVVTESDSEGTSYTAAVEYTYTVVGNQFSGNVIRYGSFQGIGDAQRLIVRFPAGAKVEVYFNPANPSDALLLPGLSSGHAFAALFMLPFNLVMLGGWLAGGAWLGQQGRLAWGVLPQWTPDGFTLRLYGISPVVVAATAVFAVSFAGVFVAAFAAIILPTELLLTIVWTAVVVVPIWLAIRQRKRAILFHVNELRGEFEIRNSSDRRPPTAGSLKELRAVLVRERSKRDSDGDVTRTYTVALLLEPGKTRLSRRCLVTGWVEANAGQLADWLAERLKLPAISPSARKPDALFS